MNYNDLHIGKNIEFLLSTSKHKKFEIAEMLGISRQQLRLDFTNKFDKITI